MVTYATAAARISSQKHLLLEVEPAEPLWNWAATGGQSNTFEVSWSHLTQTSVIKGGMYRQLIGVEEDGTALTETDSIANVEANVNSFYHDEAAQKIYVHVTGAADPDTLDMMAGVFKLHFSTTGKVLVKTAGTEARDFDGASDYYKKTSALDGDADSKECIFSCWFRLDGGDGTEMYILGGDTAPEPQYHVNIFRTTANKIRLLLYDSSFGVVIDVSSRTTFTASIDWHHLYLSVNAARAGSYPTALALNLYVDGVHIKASGATVVDAEIDFTLSRWTVAAKSNSGNSEFDGALSEIYFNPGEYLGSNGHLKFRDARGNPVELGDSGELPTGTSPAIYAPDGDVSNNLGTGGDFTAVGSPAIALGLKTRRSIYYEKRILAGTEVGVAEKASDLIVGLSRTSSGRVALANHDKLFDIPSKTWSWKNRAARYLFGINDAGLGSYLTIRELVVDDIAPTEQDLGITLVDGIDMWLRRFPPTPHLSGTAYGEGVSGTRVPILIGVKTDIIPDLVDNEDASANEWIYKIADDTKQDLDAVAAVYAINKSTGARQTLTLAVDYTVDLTDCSITVDDSFDAGAEIEEVYEIRCDATGQPAATGDTSTDYLKWPGEIAHWLLNTFLDAADTSLDLDSFADADANAPYELGFWIKKETNVREVLRTLGKSVLGDVRTEIDGTVKFYVWTPWEGSADAESYTDEDFSAFEGDPKMETVYYKTVVRYDEDPANSGSFEIESVTDNATNYLVEGAQVLTVDTFLKSSSDAQLMAQRINFLYRGTNVEMEFTERGIRLMGAGRNMRIRVTKTRAPTSTGALSNRLMEVVELDKDLDAPRVSGRLADLKDLVNLIGNWTAATAPTWGNATAEEKANSGFWTDASGLADSADQSSKNVSLWW